MKKYLIASFALLVIALVMTIAVYWLVVFGSSEPLTGSESTVVELNSV